MNSFCAIDLGATSGRVALGRIDSGRLFFEIIHRFPTKTISGPVNSNGEPSLYWDFDALLHEIITGLKIASEKSSITSIGVDTWAVDYVSYDVDGKAIAPVYAYRDGRTKGIREKHVTSDFEKEIYSSTGIQFLPFNTIYQLLAAKDENKLDGVSTFLLLPDAINNFLCGSKSVEVTNASTTQLLNARTRQWDSHLISQLNLPEKIFPKLHEPGTRLGAVNAIAELNGVEVIAIGSHDTASAVAATPLSEGEDSIYISSGTWSLIGCELDQPVTTSLAKEWNLTNELGVANTIRFLKNVSGMWILSECMREWQTQGKDFSLQILLGQAKAIEFTSIIDPNDARFIEPGNMLARITSYLEETDQQLPKNEVEVVRCMLESLARSYAEVIKEIEETTNKNFAQINIVGGGSANNLLNQLTANYSGKKVIAGPQEATLLGNIGMQAIVAGEIKDISELRALIRASFNFLEFHPE